MSERRPFDPAAHLTRIAGAAYLEVKWRLVWLRAEQPDASIDTELVEHVPGQHAVCRARVVLPSGASATGWGMETHADFPDYVEKAETKALGRALAALGFGTQFSQDFEATPGPVAEPPSPRQAAYAQHLAAARGWSPDQLEALAEARFGAPLAGLDRRAMSALIDHLRTQPGPARAGQREERADA
jgi:hypothetical protein